MRGRRGRGFGRDADPDGVGSAFPWIVGWGSLAAAALVFVTATVPARREADALREVEERLVDELERHETRTHELGHRRRHLGSDPEVLLLEFDRQDRLPPGVESPGSSTVDGSSRRNSGEPRSVHER